MKCCSMKKNKFIEDYSKEKSGNHDELVVTLNENKSNIHLKRISKPGVQKSNQV